MGLWWKIRFLIMLVEKVFEKPPYGGVFSKLFERLKLSFLYL
jgi:hypothetical protein